METIPDLASLGAFVRRRRQTLGLTQRELGQRIEWAQERISLLERGGYGLPSLIILARLASAVESPLTALIAALGYEEPSPAVERESPNCGALLYALERFLAIRAVALDTVLRESCDVAARVMGADMVETYRHDAAGHRLVAVGCSSSPLGRQQREAGLDDLPLDRGGPIVEVFATGRPLMTRANEQLHGLLHRDLGVQSLLAARIDAGDSRFGVLAAESTSRGRFSEEEFHFFLAVAHWVGLIAQRARLIEQQASA